MKTFLGDSSGSISLSHNFEGFYPRLLVGNIQNSFPSVSFTHSYYDCTSCDTDSDFWSRASDNFYDSSVYLPLFLTNNCYTDLVIYPNFSPSDFNKLKFKMNDDFYKSSWVMFHRAALRQRHLVLENLF